MIKFVTITPVDKGWSGDKKFHAVAEDGREYLLRVMPPEKSARQRDILKLTRRLRDMGVPLCRPVALEECSDGAYLLQDWIDGRDALKVIPQLSPDEQYAYGLNAGRILTVIHSVPPPEDAPDWETRFGRKLDRKLRLYSECPLKYERGGLFVEFIAENRRLLRGRPQCLQHGDYHIGNMMLDRAVRLVVIDFDRIDYGDPWEEFNRIVWCAQASRDFAFGMMDGYFDGCVPDIFWRLTALYISSNTLSSLPWAIPFGQKELDVMTAQAREVLEWYGDMSRTTPSWYQKREVKQNDRPS